MCHYWIYFPHLQSFPDREQVKQTNPESRTRLHSIHNTHALKNLSLVVRCLLTIRNILKIQLNIAIPEGGFDSVVSLVSIVVIIKTSTSG